MLIPTDAKGIYRERGSKVLVIPESTEASLQRQINELRKELVELKASLNAENSKS